MGLLKCCVKFLQIMIYNIEIVNDVCIHFCYFSLWTSKHWNDLTGFVVSEIAQHIFVKGWFHNINTNCLHKRLNFF